MSGTVAPRLRSPTPRVALLLVAALVVGVLLYLGGEALTPFLIGLLLIYVLDPPVRSLARRGLPRVLAVLLVYAVVLVGLIGGLTLLLRPLAEQIAAFGRDLPRFSAALDEQLARLTEVYDRLQLPTPIRDAIQHAFSGASQGAGGVDAGALLPIARTIAGTLSSLFGFLIVPVWAFYILKDREALLARFDAALPPSWRRDTWAVLGIVERIFGRWLRAQLVLGLVVGGMTFAGLLLLGWLVDARFLQFAVLLAVVAGLLELLPIIGPIISMIPALLVALTVSPQGVLAVLILYIAVQQFENNLLVPKIQGDAIDLHPSVVIFSLILGGAIAGLLGAILALPVVAAGRDIYRYLFRRLSPPGETAPPEEVVEGDTRGEAVAREESAPPSGGPAPRPALEEGAVSRPAHPPVTQEPASSAPQQPRGVD